MYASIIFIIFCTSSELNISIILLRQILTLILRRAHWGCLRRKCKRTGSDEILQIRILTSYLKNTEEWNQLQKEKFELARSNEQAKEVPEATACKSNSLQKQQPAKATAYRSNSLQKQQPAKATAYRSNSLPKQQPTEATAYRSNSLQSNSLQKQQLAEATAYRSNSLQKQQPTEATACRSNSLQKQQPTKATAYRSNSLLMKQPGEATAWWSNSLQKQQPTEAAARWCNSLVKQQPASSSSSFIFKTFISSTLSYISSTLSYISSNAQLGSDVCPDMWPLQTSMNTAHSECKPSSTVSSFTHSLHVFLPLPTHLTPATTTFLQADTQSSPFLRSTCRSNKTLFIFTIFILLQQLINPNR